MTLLKHSAQYLVARGLPGALNFVAVAAYSRLLAPSEYGQYALVLAIVGMVGVFAYRWLVLVVGRFLPRHGDDPQRFMAWILALYGSVGLFVSIAAAAAAFLVIDAMWHHLLALGTALLLWQVWSDLNLAVARAQLRPWVYGRILGLKTVVSLTAGVALAVAGLGSSAPLLGLITGHTVAFLFVSAGWWKGIRPRWPNRVDLRQFGAYGLPLTVTFALMWVVTSSDRILLAWLLDDEAVGLYAVAYELAFPALTLALSIINTAALPLAIRALESAGTGAAARQMALNGRLVIIVAFAGAAGMVSLGPMIVEVVIGAAFRAEALVLFPIITVGAMIAGIKSFHFDIAFHLSRDSRWLVLTSSLAAIVNVGLNLVLIPAFGLIGAATATAVAYALAAIASAVLGHRVFALPPARPMFLRALAYSLLIGAAGWVVGNRPSDPLLGLLVGGIVVSCVGVVTAISFNEFGLRSTLLTLLRRGRPSA